MQLITTIFNAFDLKPIIIVPAARNSINPVSNAVRCGVGEVPLHYACRRHDTPFTIRYSLYHGIA